MAATSPEPALEAGGSVARAAVREVRLGTTKAEIERRADGSVLLRLVEKLKPYPVRLTQRLIYWASEAPERTFLAERGSQGGWRRMSYAKAFERVRAVGQALIDRKLSRDRPVMILSENDLDNATLALACLHVGVPYIPLTPAYSLMTSDFAQLKNRIAACGPGLVFAASGERYEQAAINAFPNVEFVVSREPPKARQVTVFAEFLAMTPTSAVESAHFATGPDTLGKVMFTSGTVGAPKGVMFSQRMLCSNRQQVVQALPFLEDEPAVQVDWLPWHHTFGGTHNVGTALYGGGSLYIDPGRPTPEGIEASVASLTEIAPTFYQNTPLGLAMLLPHLQTNAALRTNFFSKLKLIYYGGAVLHEHVWDGLDRIAIATIGKRILIVTGIGSTETGPTPTSSNVDPERKPVAGLPVPGCEAKVTPVGNKLELRVRGPNVTPGYWRDPERTKAAFDEEGFFCMGDAVTFIDAARPELGLKFDGRIAENFKLSSGTWVNVAEVRDMAIAAFAPYARDVVVCGHDQDWIAALVFPDVERLREFCPDVSREVPLAHLVGHPAVRAHFEAKYFAMSARQPPSKRIARLVIEAEPPSLDLGEVTAKMSISQAAVLARRADVVAELYGDVPSPRTIVLQAADGLKRAPS